MSTSERQTHWQDVYQTKGERDVGWFEEDPAVSRDLVRASGVAADASIVDIGGGASRLVDVLIEAGFRFVTVLDLSDSALAVSRDRLGLRGTQVNWIVADVTTWQPSRTYDVWHDRAAFHFLTDPNDCAAYAERVRTAVRPGGHVIIGTFALDGPERCSGLPVVRHDANSLGRILGPSFHFVENRLHAHRTPTGASQRFQFSRFECLCGR